MCMCQAEYLLENMMAEEKKQWVAPVLTTLSVDRTLGGGGFDPNEAILVDDNPGSTANDFPAFKS